MREKKRKNPLPRHVEIASLLRRAAKHLDENTVQGVNVEGARVRTVRALALLDELTSRAKRSQ